MFGRWCGMVAAGVVACAAGAAWGADWPMFGGSGARNMVSTETGLPEKLAPERGKYVNLKWSAKVGSKAYGTPVVSRGRVYVGTNNTPGWDPRYVGDRGVLRCFDEKTGEMRWQLAAPKYRGIKSFDLASLGICSSPAVEGDRLYVMSNRCEALCLDAKGMADGNDGPFMDETAYLTAGTEPAGSGAKPTPAGKGPAKITPGATDGDIIWLYDFIKDMDVSPHDATDCSPVIHGDLVYFSTNNGVNAGHKVSSTPDAPTLVAFDKKTGKLAGTDDCLISRRVFHGNWSNPACATIGGKALIFLGGGDGFCYAFEAEPTGGKDGKPGVLKKVWSTDCNPAERKEKGYHSANGPSEIIATPVVYKDKVYVAVGQDPNHKTGVGNLLCLEAATGKVVWSDATVNRSLSTAAVTSVEGTDLLFMADFSGYIYCIDATNGQRYWAHPTDSSIWGSCLAADGKVYVGDSHGVLWVFAASKTKREISENELGGGIESTPVAANGVLYVLTHGKLLAFEKKP